MTMSTATSPIRTPEELQELGRRLGSLLFPEPATEEEEKTRTYAVLDGASIPELIKHLYAEGQRPEFACLYRGELEPDIAEVAPYLVRLAPDHPFTEWLLAEGWGKHWGVFVRGQSTFKDVHRHFRHFLRVKNPEGKTFLFRLYDPRVARIFLPTCQRDELQLVFGPLSRWLLEADDAATCLDFTLAGGAILPRQHRLLPPELDGPGRTSRPTRTTS